MQVLVDLSRSRAPAPAFAAMGAGWGAFAAFVPQIKAGLGASDAAFGLALFCSALGLVCAMWLAPLADARLGRRALPVAAGLLSLSFLLPPLAPSLPLFALAMGGVGLCSGLTDVVMNSRVSELEGRWNASLMNLNHSMFSFAYMGGALTAGAAREGGLAPVAVFALIAAIVLPATRMMNQFAAEPPGDESATHGMPWAVVAWGGTIVLIAFLAENAVEGWSALHLERTLGGGAAEGALGPALLGLTMGIGRFSGQLVAHRFRESVVLRWAAVLSALGAALAATAQGIAVAYIGFIALGFGISVLAPMALALVGRRVPRRHRTRAIARVAVIGFLGFFLGPPLMGVLSEYLGLRIAFAAVGLALAVVPLLLIRPPAD